MYAAGPPSPGIRSKTDLPFSHHSSTNGPTSPNSVTMPGFTVMNRVGSFKTRATMSDTITAPPTPMSPDMSFYELLGIPASGTTLDIKTAYKQLARKYHPDVSPPGRVDEYTERFIMVQEAYETLSDPRRRALYDTDMSKGLHHAFSARRRHRTDEEDDQMVGKGEWKSKWTSQLSDLKKRSKFKENNSWAAQMRKQRSDYA